MFHKTFMIVNARDVQIPDIIQFEVRCNRADGALRRAIVGGGNDDIYKRAG